MTERAVDLPLLPGQDKLAQQKLLDVNIVVYLLDGSCLSGVLYSLSDQYARMVLMDSHDQVQNLPFAKIRYFRFALAAQCFTLDVLNLLKQSLQFYDIHFSDGSSLRGKANFFITDHSGLHLVTLHGDEVIRWFVPQTAVKDYRIDPLIVEQDNVGDGGENDPDELPATSLSAVILDSTQLRYMLDHQTNYLRNINFKNKLFGQMLLEQGMLDGNQLADILLRQQDNPGKKIGELLQDSKLLTPQQIHLILARKLGIPFVDLKRFDVDHQVLNLVPMDLARHYVLIPLCSYQSRLVVAMDDPTNHEAIETIRFISGKVIEPVISTREDIESAIYRYYGADDSSLDDDAVRNSLQDDEKAKAMELREAERLAYEKPIVRLVQGMLMDAVRKRASDIHIRPLEHEVHLLYRIDGTLLQIRSFSKALLPAIVSRIKIIGRMDVAERRLPQDGRTSVSDHGEAVDLRLSIIPTINGESVVIRLLNSKVGLKKVSELGFSPHDEEVFVDLLHKSYGMILVTGPTGSGKSTTLYAALQEVMEQNVNIITVEDPVEYHINNIEQIQVNSAPGYTFAEALRHILRHDPDVIMVGEIRDRETAKIAVESSLTGHLVLSTLHTNNAATAITRMAEMGLEPYMLSSTLLGVLAQRLVRRNCPQCVAEETVDDAIRRFLNVSAEEVFYRGKGCDDCNHTGYSGRMAVYELLAVTPEVRALIEMGRGADAIFEQAVRTGMLPLTANALARARMRETSLAEVYRVRLE